MIWKHRESTSVPSNGIMVCPRCLSQYTEDSLFCARDGSRLLLEKDVFKKEIMCRQCGAYITGLEEECPECGYTQNHSNPVVRLTPLLSSAIVLWKLPYEFGRGDLRRVNGAEYVNTKHLLFYQSENTVMVKDLKSLNGTKINGKPIGKGGSAKEAQIKSGDILELAPNAQGEGMVKVTVDLVFVRGI